jgi:eukaryotic-like serine/threonine-protein kinase
MPPCPSPEQLQLLLTEQLPASAAAAVEAHLQTCAACQQALEELIGSHGFSRASPTAATVTEEFLRRLEQEPLANVPRRLAGPSPTDVSDATPRPEQFVGDPWPAPTQNRYARTRVHARGGIGRVWLARDADLGRDVALKELLPEHANKPGLWARFLAEARITGQLEHPSIVPVYELCRLGTDRVPYYTMRFVRGKTLSEAVRIYHTRRTAGAAGPLELRGLLSSFVAVCNALAYAHARGVLHRDLKGSNVILGDYGEVMVLDWGLAKVVGSGQPAGGSEAVASAAVDEPEASATVCGAGFPPAGTEAGWKPAPQPTDSPRPGFVPIEPGASDRTVEGQVLGTPGYMAPEQAEGRPDLVDARTDVYGLGAILYEILTSQPPFVGADTHDVLRRVQHETPVPPRQLHWDTPAALDAICLKALAKPKTDRYATAGDVAREVERWLADEPVQAYPDPLAARLRRRARRHPTAIASAAALLLAGLLGLGFGLAAVRAEQRHTASERDRAEQNYAAAQEAGRQAAEQAARAGALNKFLIVDLLAEAAPEKNPRAKRITVEEVLDKAAAKVEKGFPGQPEVEADVRRAIGGTYRRLGLGERARPQLEKALALRRQRLGPEHADTLEAVDELANVLLDQGKLAEAEPLLRQNLDVSRRVLGPEHVQTLNALNNLASLLQEQGKLAEAEPLWRQNLEIRLRVAGPDHPDTQAALNNLAGLLHAEGRLAEAEPLYRQSLEGLRRLLGPEHPDTLATVNNLAMLLQAQGKWDEAEPLLRQALDTNRRVGGPEHPDTLVAVNNLAALLRDRGKLDEAEPLFRQNLEATLRVQGPEHPDTLIAINNLARLLEARGKLAEAEPLCRRNLDARRRVLGPNHPQTLSAQTSLALLLDDRGNHSEALVLAREALDRGRLALPAGHLQLLASLAAVGGLLTEAGKPAEAEPLLRECLAGRRKALPAGHWQTAAAGSLLGDCLAAQHKTAEAELLLLDTARVLEGAPGIAAGERRKARARLARFYQALGKPAEASRWK